MHPIPKDLDLSRLLGGEVIQICLGWHQIQIHLHPSGTFSIECPWTLSLASKVVEQSAEQVGRGIPTHLGTLLGRSFDGWTVMSETLIQFRFSEDAAITLRADSREYECFQIEPLGVVI